MKYPEHWWQDPNDTEPLWWEILPSAVKPDSGMVILSKRNELGLLSNFAATPFVFEGRSYSSLEGFWQSLKYPESPKDERFEACPSWPYSRFQVEGLTGVIAQRSGVAAEEIMKTHGIEWITYRGEKIDYKGKDQDRHFDLISAATLCKVQQNKQVAEVLFRTRGLQLLPDHHQSPDSPRAWRYFEIMMDLRRNLSL